MDTAPSRCSLRQVRTRKLVGFGGNWWMRRIHSCLISARFILYSNDNSIVTAVTHSHKTATSRASGGDHRGASIMKRREIASRHPRQEVVGVPFSLAILTSSRNELNEGY